MTWPWLAAASAALLGLYEVSKKLSVRDNSVLPVLVLSTTCSWLVLTAALICVQSLLPAAEQYGLFLVAVSLRVHALVALKAAIVSCSWALSFRALSTLPLSVAGPLRSCSPLITVVGAVFLFDEAPSGGQWAGLSLVLLGAVLFSWMGHAEKRGRNTSRALWMLSGGMVLTASSGLYDKFLLQSLQLPPTTLQYWFTTYNLVVQLTLAGVLWWPHRRRLPPVRWTGSIAAVGVLLTAADQFYFRAVSQPEALVSVVSLIRRSSVVLSFAAGGILLKERWMLRKSLPLVAVLAGLVLLLAW